MLVRNTRNMHVCITTLTRVMYQRKISRQYACTKSKYEILYRHINKGVSF